MRAMVFVFLVPAVVASAIANVYARHESRKLFVELQELEQQRDAMNVEWGQLQLEQSTYTTHGKVESAARKRLGMHIPAPREITIIRP
jgi:cell division protein FtsL